MIGAYTSSFQMPLYDLGDTDDLGRRAGMCMTFAAIGSIMGPPISGAINKATGGYSAVGFYAGECL
jgi:MFS transporter, MCT family, solute carrier family 16 (monocarboxylic acid transporters), member 10